MSDFSSCAPRDTGKPIPSETTNAECADCTACAAFSLDNTDTHSSGFPRCVRRTAKDILVFQHQIRTRQTDARMEPKHHSYRVVGVNPDDSRITLDEGLPQERAEK